MTDPHADLRAMLEALPSGGITRDADAMSRWLLRAPALVRAMLEERDALKAEVERLRKPSVIRDGFPPDSLLEEAARLGRELADSLDDLWREGRRRMEAKKCKHYWREQGSVIECAACHVRLGSKETP